MFQTNDMNIISNNNNSVSWELAPYPALIKIFEYLPRTDRFYCSLVCRSWSYAFSDPYLWEEIKFVMKDNFFNEDVEKAVAFTETKFIISLKRLEIHFLRNRCHHSSSLCKGISTVLANMTGKTFLFAFVLKGNWCLRRSPHISSCCHSVIISLEKFLLSQKYLHELQVVNSDLLVDDGIRILKAISRGCGDYLQLMDITHFFQHRHHIITISEYRTCMNQFINMQKLILNYSYLSEQVLKILYYTCCQHLKYLQIICHYLEPHMHVISENTWRKLVKSCLDLEVNFIIDEIVNLQIFSQIMPSVIPLKQLMYIAGYTLRTQGDLQDDGAPIVGYISSSFANVLEIAHLDFGFLRIRALPIFIINLFQNCKCLRKVRLEGVFPIRLASDACRAALEGKSVLKQLRISFHFATYEDSVELAEISSKYCTKLQKLNFNYEFNLVCFH